MTKKEIDIYLLIDGKTWSCITNITPLSLKQEIESMMGGYGISRESFDSDSVIYSGNFSSKDWFYSIFRMYGFSINIIVS